MRERDVADLVEKQRAAVGDLEQALLVGDGAGEGALDVAEEFALQQVLRQRSAIHGHEGLGPAQAVVMNRAGDQLLAGAAFAGDEHGGVGCRALRDQPVHLLHPRARPDHVVQAVPGIHGELEIQVLLPQRPALERPGHGELELLRVEGLRQVVEGAELHALHRGLDLGQAGEHDHLDVGMRLLDPPQDLQAVHLRHHDVEDDQVVVGFVDPLQRFDAVVGGLQRVPAAFQDPNRAPDDDFLVVGNQYPGAHSLLPVGVVGCASRAGAIGR